MVVDDSAPDRFIARKLLGRNQIAEQVTPVESGIEALEHIKALAGDTTRLPQVIFLDIRMPIMDGFEFLECFEALPAGLRTGIVIYMLTSSAYVEDRKKAEQFPSVKGFIIKPLTEKTLAEFLAL